jgi:hypothetical protein
MPSALARFIPCPRLRQVDRIAVSCHPAEVWAVVRATDLYDVRFVRALFRARSMPERAGARLRGRHLEPAPTTATLDDIVRPGAGFRLLAETPGEEFVAGAIGKFWKPEIPFVETSPASFAAFHEPGFGRVAWSIQVHPRPGGRGGSWVGVELRVDATDAGAWREFVPYWTLIGPFSHLIRRTLLRRLAKRLGPPAPDEECALPGDDVLPWARVSKTHAITIEAPPQLVWPWLIQMGRRRAGWYSVDDFDNGGVPSAERIIPQLQRVAVGDILPTTSKGERGFAVLSIDPERSLVLGSPTLLAARASAVSEQERWSRLEGARAVTWAFALEPIGDVATRLFARVRSDFRTSAHAEVARMALLPLHDAMEYVQLRNLKHRAENLALAGTHR